MDYRDDIINHVVDMFELQPNEYNVVGAVLTDAITRLYEKYKYNCMCGSIFRLDDKLRHRETKKHRKFKQGHIMKSLNLHIISDLSKLTLEYLGI